jgi:Concanavalin A-like lectin/glucanases superfamily
MRLLYFLFSVGMLLTSCTPFELPLEKSLKICQKPTGITATPDINDPRKYTFSLNGITTDVASVTWKITTNNNMTLVATTNSLGSVNNYSFTATNDDTYIVSADIYTTCGDAKQTLSSAYTINTMPPTSSLVAYYPFNGNANDESGNANHGIVNGATLTTGRLGKVNSAYKFGGINNPGVISVKNSESLKFITAFSVSLWLQMENFAGMNGFFQNAISGTHCLYAKNHDTGGFWHSIGGDTQKINIGGGNNNNGRAGNFGFGATIQGNYVGKWTHVVQVVGNGKVQLYIDNTLANEVSASADFTVANNRDLFFGKYSDIWYPLNGTLDDIRIYNSALTASQVRALFQE